MKTGRVAAVAEEARRRWQAEGLAPADAFWVRNRRNTGLVLVSPNGDPDAPSSEEILGGEGVETVVGQADLDQGIESFEDDAVDSEPAESSAADSAQEPLEQIGYSDIPLTIDAASSKTLLSDGAKAPVINLEADRIANILADEPAVFEIADSPTASGREPIHALHDKGYWAVRDHKEMIEQEASAQRVDPDLIKAIMYVENAHGASYGRFFESLGVSDTILPMNINPETWEGLIGEHADFSDAR